MLVVTRYKLLRDEHERDQLQQKLLQQQQEQSQQQLQLQQQQQQQQQQTLDTDEPDITPRFPASKNQENKLSLDKQRTSEEWTRLAEQQSVQLSNQSISSTEVFDGQPCTSPPEDGKPGAETIDLHSSASDEGILTKESSTEELIDRELDLPHHMHGHDSEE